jgi:asparagine synthase (glutamine-hydrolysing)
VLLTGDGADACVAGSPLVFDSLLRKGRLRTLWRYLDWYRRYSHQPLHKTLAFGCIAPLLPLGLQRRLISAYVERAIRHNRHRLMPSWLTGTLREDLLQRHLQLSVEAERRRRFASPAREREYRQVYPPEVARHLVPWPIEIWRPFADRRLHEFLLAVPPEEKFSLQPDGGTYSASKQLLRRGLRGILPESIRTRTAKTTFATVVESEFTRNWHFYEATFGPAGRPEIARRRYIDQGQFWRWLQQAGTRGEGLAGWYVTNLVELETWLRRFNLPRRELASVIPSTSTWHRRVAVHQSLTHTQEGGEPNFETVQTARVGGIWAG